MSVECVEEVVRQTDSDGNLPGVFEEGVELVLLDAEVHMNRPRLGGLHRSADGAATFAQKPISCKFERTQYGHLRDGSD
jgi:hypothetical protein